MLYIYIYNFATRFDVLLLIFHVKTLSMLLKDSWHHNKCDCSEKYATYFMHICQHNSRCFAHFRLHSIYHILPSHTIRNSSAHTGDNNEQNKRATTAIQTALAIWKFICIPIRKFAKMYSTFRIFH